MPICPVIVSDDCDFCPTTGTHLTSVVTTHKKPHVHAWSCDTKHVDIPLGFHERVDHVLVKRECDYVPLDTHIDLPHVHASSCGMLSRDCGLPCGTYVPVTRHIDLH